MANEGMQTRYRSLEEQVQQIRESQQKSTDELRQALMEQNQALTNAINTTVTDLTLRMTQLNTVPASSSNYSPPPATPARTDQVTSYQPTNVHHPRSPRCDMSTFDGTSPLDWVFQVEKYFNYYDIPEEQKLDVASFYMVAQALSWYQWMHKNQQLSSWRTFTVALEQRFGPSLYVNHCAALFKLTQKTTVAAYQYEFETVSNRVSDFHPDALFDCFISGLKPMIQHELAVLRPATLSDAIALAKLVEDKLRDSRALSPKSVSWRHHGSETTHSPPFCQINTAPLLPLLEPTSQNTNPKPSLPIKRLTAAELQA
nr:Retrotransposon gag protein [Ipomoea batatas]